MTDLLGMMIVNYLCEGTVTGFAIGYSYSTATGFQVISSVGLRREKEITTVAFRSRFEPGSFRMKIRYQLVSQYITKFP
jgi:hypothetical protein